MYELLRGVQSAPSCSNNATRDTLLDQRSAINNALQEARDGLAARHAVEAHLNFVETSLW
jgi:DNA-binding FadR family transcriptional regulator